jgi:hypothetical protein
MPPEHEGRAPNFISQRFCELSPAGQVLVVTMRRVQFGRFEGLRICSGDPIFDPPPRLVRVARIGSTEALEVSESADWILKAPIRDLFREFARLENGSIDRLEFRRGLPCLVEIAIAAIQTGACSVDRGKQ